MKKDLSILVALLALIVGVVSYHLNPFTMPVTLCEISRNIKYYESKPVRVKVLMMAGGNYDEIVSPVFIADSKTDCRTKAQIRISSELMTDESFSKLSEGITWKRFEVVTSEAGIKAGNAVEIELIGKIEDVKKSIIADKKPAFVLRATDFKQLSEIRHITQEEFDEKYFTVADF